MHKLNNCFLINLPKINDPRGNLTFIEGNNHIPFEIKRVYYTYDVPGGSDRGAHAHKNLQQLIIAMSGSFDVVLDDGFEKKRFHLNRSYFGLYVCPMMWRSWIISLPALSASCWHLQLRSGGLLPRL
jgi:hypothetical protein